ncbi:MAG TPA: hypothetical protein VM580_19355 [Labilithrix sp.]|nr:hypothetical protein [Labilithrix sp.]
MHPDWSALGDKVVVSLSKKAPGNKDMAGGSRPDGWGHADRHDSPQPTE